jgi:hypothetical protein
MTTSVAHGEDFSDVFCQVPEHVFDQFMAIMKFRRSIDVNGRQAVISMCRTGHGEHKPGRIPCLLTGRYMEPTGSGYLQALSQGVTDGSAARMKGGA